MEATLINGGTLQTKFGLTKPALDEMLKKLGIKPLASADYGGTPTALYDSKEACRMIQNELDRRDEAAKAFREPAKVIDLASSRRDAIKSVEESIIASCDAIEEKVDKLAADVERLQTQNRLLLRAIDALRESRATVSTEPEAAQGEQVDKDASGIKSPTAAAEQFKAEKILIFALPNGLRNKIMLEFSDCFEIEFLSQDQVPPKNLAATINRADHVFVCRRWIQKSFNEFKRYAGQRVSFVEGGLSALQSAMTERYASREVKRSA